MKQSNKTAISDKKDHTHQQRPICSVTKSINLDCVQVGNKKMGFLPVLEPDRLYLELAFLMMFSWI